MEESQPKPVSIPTPEPASVSIPTPELAPVVIQVPEQKVPPPTQVVSDVRELLLLGPSVLAAPPNSIPEDHSPWASVISRNDNLSSQPRTPPNPPRMLSPKQSHASFAGQIPLTLSRPQRLQPEHGY